MKIRELEKECRILSEKVNTRDLIENKGGTKQ